MSEECNPKLARRLTTEKVQNAIERVNGDPRFALEGCKLELIGEERWEDMVNLIKDHYIPDEPMGKSINLQWNSEMYDLVLGSLRHNLSIALIHVGTNAIIAGQVIAIENKQENLEYGEFTAEELKKTYRTLRYLNSICVVYEHYNVDEVVHLWQLTVHKAQRRKGIAAKHIEALVEVFNCLDIGPVVLQVECTNTGSQKAFEKNGFTTLAEVLYSDYKEDGEVVYANTGNHKSVKLYGKIVK